MIRLSEASVELYRSIVEPLIKKDLNECWLFPNTYRGGYGCFTYHRTQERAHRVAYKIAHGGRIPKDMCVLHRCDVRNCVNPHHLFLGDRTTNNKDRAAKGRSAKYWKFTAEQIEEIKRDYASWLGINKTNRGCIKEKAKEYGCNRRTLWMIGTGQRRI
jgi:hypothetical protein